MLFLKGIAWIEKFLNFAGPAVYVVMVALLIAIWVQAGDRLLPAVGSIFNNSSVEGWAAVGAFFGVIGTMIAYFSAVIINFGDFARFSKTEKAMKRGNFYGLPVSLTFFTFLSLFTTAGAYIVLQGGEGEPLTNPAEIVGLVGNVFLTIIAAITFVIATIGINLVANFIPPAYDLSNLNPQRISFKTGGYLTAALGFIVGALWVATISQIGLADVRGHPGRDPRTALWCLVADYYIVQRRSIKVADLFSMDESGRYFYQKGWNTRALIAIGIAAVFSIAAVWVPELRGLSGFAWVIGALLGAIIYTAVMWSYRPKADAADAGTAGAGAPSRSPRRAGPDGDERRVIRAGRTFLGGSFQPAAVVIEGGRIADVVGVRDRVARCAGGAGSRRRGAAARAGRLPRARQRAGPHRVGGVPLGDARRGGGRGHDDRGHAAELAAADDDRRGAGDQAGGGRGIRVHRCRVLGRSGAGQPRSARTAARGGRLRLQVLPLAVGCRRVPAPRSRPAARRHGGGRGARLTPHRARRGSRAARPRREPSVAGTRPSSPHVRPRARPRRSRR